MPDFSLEQIKNCRIDLPGLKLSNKGENGSIKKELIDKLIEIFINIPEIKKIANKLSDKLIEAIKEDLVLNKSEDEIRRLIEELYEKERELINRWLR